MRSNCLVNLGKRKFNIAISTIQEKVARALNVTLEEINLDAIALLKMLTYYGPKQKILTG